LLEKVDAPTDVSNFLNGKYFVLSAKKYYTRTNQPLLMVTVKRRLLSVFVDVSRMSPATDTHRALFHSIPLDWTRPRDRPHPTWMWIIKEYQLHVSLEEVHRLATNHAGWRGLLYGAACQFSARYSWL